MENSIASFLLSASLYDICEINRDNIQELLDLFKGRVAVNSYCQACKTERVYHSSAILIAKYRNGNSTVIDYNKVISLYNNLNINRTGKWNWPDVVQQLNIRTIVVEFTCTMDPAHKIFVTICFENSLIRKIGQYPSIADLSIPQLKQYEKVLDQELLRELKRGVGLHAHGIGAGSYIYLRRVFEKLVNEAQDKALVSNPNLRAQLESARMAEKIKLLSGYLPHFLVENDTVYKILSKGIHELSEKECNEFFNILLESILMILDEKKTMVEKEEKQERIRRDLNNISSSI